MSGEGGSVGPARALQVPSDVHGMTTLDKGKFSCRVLFPVISVNPRLLGRIRGCTDKYVVKNLGRTIKQVMNTEDPDRKLVVFNPNLVNDDETKDKILENVVQVTSDSSLHFSEQEYTVRFEDWDMRSIFRAVLPSGVEYSAFTQTGHLIHCNFRDELVPYRDIIGQILLAKIQNCRTVVYKADKIDTKFRTFQVTLIAGESDYVVETTEDGTRFKMDFTKVYWNSRLSFEHARVLKNVTSKSLVFDACAGIGPFAIPAAKRKGARLVWANDLNPESVKWMNENIRINKVADGAIRVFNEDAVHFIREHVAEYLLDHQESGEEGPPDAAHVIMNLPALAVTFLPAFRGMLRAKSASGRVPSADPFPIIVYCYLFAKSHVDVESSWYCERARQMAQEQLRYDGVSIRARFVRDVSNRKQMVCVECTLPWSLLYAEELSEEEEQQRRQVSGEIAEEQEDEENVEEEEGDPPKKRKKNDETS